MFALSKTNDAEMLQLFRRFNARLNIILTPTEIDTYARYLFAPWARVTGTPPTFAQRAVWTKVQADRTATTLSTQIVAALARRKRELQDGLGRN